MVCKMPGDLEGRSQDGLNFRELSSIYEMLAAVIIHVLTKD